MEIGDQIETVKILAIKLHFIGDVVMITPSLRRLRHALPDTQIDILIGNWSQQVIYGNPNVDNFYPVFDKWFSLANPVNFFHLFRLLGRLRSQRYDGVLVFHSNPAICRFGRAVGAPITIAYNYSDEDDSDYSFWDKHRHDTLNANALVDKFCDVISDGNISKCNDNDLRTEWIVSAEELLWAQNFLNSLNIHQSPVVIHPGAGVPLKGTGNEKQWFPEKFAELITILHERNLGPILLEGTKSELSIAEKIQALLPFSVTSIMGMTNLLEVAALLSISRLLITNDTRTMHIGGAVGVPLVAIFGPTSSHEKLPICGNARAVQSRAPCSPCTYFSFNGCLFDDFECMKEISTDRVMEAIEDCIQEADNQSLRL